MKTFRLFYHFKLLNKEDLKYIDISASSLYLLNTNFIDELEQISHKEIYLINDTLLSNDEVSSLLKNKVNNYKIISSLPNVSNINIISRDQISSKYNNIIKYDIYNEFISKFSSLENIVSNNNPYINSIIKTNVILSELSNSNYWNNIGGLYSLSIILIYIKHIIKEKKRNDKLGLAFIARDSFLIEKVFNILYPEVNTNYIYAPRKLTSVCLLEYNKNNKSKVNSIINYYKGKSIKFSSLINNNLEDSHLNIENNISILNKLSKEELKLYKRYLTDKIDSRDLLVIDSITASFSAQRLLERALPESNIRGLYWIVFEIYNKHLDHSFKSIFNGKNNHLSFGYTKNWDFMEFLITSDKPPVKGISKDGDIEFDTPNEYELNRIKIYKDITLGCINSINIIKDIKDNLINNIDEKDVVNLINNLVDLPSDLDKDNLKNIKISREEDHSKYINLFNF